MERGDDIRDAMVSGCEELMKPQRRTPTETGQQVTPRFGPMEAGVPENRKIYYIATIINRI
jgi:hypothetical protein